MGKYIFSFFIILFSYDLLAQELRAIVIINHEQVQTSEKQVFTDMKNTLTTFLNTQQWTNETYKPEERINCRFLITLGKRSTLGNYEATVQVHSSRPIYGTNYESLLLNYIDRNWTFQYTQNEPIVYSENAIGTNLTAMLAFYAYIIIGLDNDSFSKLGGTPYFQKALNLLNNAQQFNAIGWQAFEDNRNRYWLIENLTNQQLSGVRESFYTIHRLGLDQFLKSPDDARTKVFEALTKIKAAHAQRQVSVLINIFFDAKSDELIQMFSDGDMPVRQKVYSILIELDPTNTGKYKKIING